MTLRARLSLLAWALVAALGLLWWSTTASTSVARIAAMQMVEPYAFAVYHQIVHNLAFAGEFYQTVHQGYDDTWTWSGHRAPALFPVAALYRLDPTAYGLARVQILLVLLGAIPAGLLGERAAGHIGGRVAGAALYLFSPPMVALALQDYQDMVLALPCLVFFAWTLQAERPWLVPLGVIAGLLPREETVPVVVVLAVLAVPWRWPEAKASGGRVRWKGWLLNVVLTGLIVGAYVAWVEAAYPSDETNYKTPLMSVLTQVGGQHGVLHLDGWPHWGGFYAWMLVPLAALGALAPHYLLPAAGLVFFHLTLPQGHAIDRAWSGHSHHLAPAVALLTVAAAEGAGRLLRLAAHPRLGRARVTVATVATLSVLALVGARFDAHATDQNHRVTLLPKNPAWVHPAWGLVEMIPADGVPAVPRDLSPTVSNRRVAYTYDGSLDSKARDEGLVAATHMVVDSRQSEGAIVWWVKGMPGAKQVAVSGPYMLWTWDADAEEDPRWEDMRDRRMRKEQPFIGPYRRRHEIPGVARFESPDAARGQPIPAIPLPRWLRP